MLFEPCGNLLQDYSACCEVLRLTEREDVYSSIMTSDKIVKQHEQRNVQNSEPEGSGFTNGVMCRSNREQLDSPDATDLPPLPLSNAPIHSEREGNATKQRRGSSTRLNQNGPSTNRRRRSSFQLKSRRDTTAVETPPSGNASSSTSGMFTVVFLRNPKFCINQRDMTPLTRAIPHCVSLVSVEMVSCGLSVESYMLLVESIFKSRLVIKVAVDFNHLPSKGFVDDPTLSPSQNLEAENGVNLEGQRVVPTPEAVAPSTEVRPHTPASLRSEAGTSRSRRRPESGSRNNISANSREAAKPTTIVENLPKKPCTIYLNPSELCGLHLVPTLLEEQLQEEKARKGKIDPKKITLLQSQHEMLQQFDHAHRIMVPRGWEGMLLTGVKYLSLRGNAIDDRSVKLITETILSNPYSQLVSLNLWGNKITDLGASYVAVLLRKNRVLTALDLGHNLIGDTGLLEIINSFQMVELCGIEQNAAYRQIMLTRPSATEAERAAAQQAVPPTAYPTYQDLYNQWFSQVIRPSRLSLEERGTATPGACSLARRRSLPYTNKNTNSRGGNSALNKAEGLSTFQRPLTPFDRFCIRVPVLDESGASTSAFIVRAPGNIVLEVLNLGENKHITLAGATEACRRLSLHEPRTEEEMQSMAVSSEGSCRWSSASVDRAHSILPSEPAISNPSNKGNAYYTSTNLLPPSVQTPELHCACLRLHTCIVSSFQYDKRDSWDEMEKIQVQIQEVLDRWPALNDERTLQSPESVVNEAKPDEQALIQHIS